MSNRPGVDKGVREEASAANLYLKQGYFTRPHIQIFPSDSTDAVSDIDVLAVKFDRYLRRQSALVEVKKDSHRISDLFKLFGFKTYYGNPETYFVTEKINETFLEIAKALGIRAVSFSKLRELSDLEGNDIKEEFTEKDITSIERFLRSIRDEVDSELFWRYHYLWLERNPYARFFHIQRLFTKTSSLTEGKARLEVLWFRKELFLQGFLACLDIASDCVDVDSTKVDSYVREKFYDIGSPKEGKLKIKQGVDGILAILRKLAEEQHQDIELPTIEVIPKYLDNLVRLIKLLVRDSRFANKYLEINDIVYRANLHGKAVGIQFVSSSKPQEQGLRETNDLLLRILHDGPILPDFNNFV